MLLNSMMGVHCTLCLILAPVLNAALIQASPLSAGLISYCDRCNFFTWSVKATGFYCLILNELQSRKMVLSIQDTESVLCS